MSVGKRIPGPPDFKAYNGRRYRWMDRGRQFRGFLRRTWERLNRMREFELKDLKSAWRFGYDYTAYKLYQPDLKGQYLRGSWRLGGASGINGVYYDHVINDKRLLNVLLAGTKLETPKIFGWFDRGAVRCPAEEQAVDSGAWILELLSREQRLVIKPLRGLKGRQVHFLSREDSRVFLDEREMTEAELGRWTSKLSGRLLTEFIPQAHYASEIYPKTTNTIRFLTMWDHEQNRPFIARAVHRIGTSRSYPVDNFNAGRGGLSVSIDLLTGVMGKGAMMNEQKDLVWVSRHPETGTEVEGVSIPSWQSLCNSVLEGCRHLYFAPYLGWDVVLREDLRPVVLELNGGIGLNVIQVHSPLLADARIRNFYQAHGVRV